MSDPDVASTTPGEAYPSDWEADVVLRDGATAHLRPIAPTDADALQAFHIGQSERSTYLRFFAPLQRLSERDLARFTTVDHRDRVALIVVQGIDPEPGAEGVEPREQIIGVGRYDRVSPDEAEVAFNIADAHHGRGLGSVLLEHLAAAARERGVGRFTAEVLPQNGRMIAVFREAGYEVSQTVEDGVVTVSFDIDPTDRSLAVMADREHRAEALSVEGLLGARSVLLVGQSYAAAGSAIDLLFQRGFASVTSGGFDAVHVLGATPRTARTQAGGAGSVSFWDRLEDVPGPVHLAVVALPARDVVALVRHLSPLGVRGMVVLSTGFAETGEEGLALQRALVRRAHAGGMRLVGPASYGFFSAAEPAFNASLAERLPRGGTIGLFCQSAPMAVPILASVENRSLGVSSFFSSGHRADVSGNDLMQFWHEDPATKVVGMVLESIGNPRKFSRIARRLAATKPVVVVTAGQSGHVVPPGHAVRATRSPRRTLEEMFRQSGVIRAQNTHRMLDIVQLVAHQPLPTGNRVGIVAGSSSLAALAAEAAASAGLEHEGRVVMVLDDTDDADMRTAVQTLYRDGSCDVVVVVHVPTVGGASPRLARAVAEAAAGSGVATVACVLGLHGVTAELSAVGLAEPTPDAVVPPAEPPAEPPADPPAETSTEPTPERVWTVPAYSTPEEAVAALGAVVQYAAWRAVDRGRPVRPLGMDRPRARALVRQHLPAAVGGGPVELDADVAAELLACYGIEVWAGRTVTTVDEAVAAATELGWPVALKSTSPLLRHRADLGGVRLDLGDPDDLRVAVAHLNERARQVGAAGVPLEVQRMAPAGVACVVRSAEDPLFGPVVSFGLAGDAVDLLGDIAYGIPPLTTVDVADLVRSARAAPRLFGYRGLPSADVAALEEIIARVSVMSADLPELRSLELHPVVVAESGAAVLAGRIQIEDVTRADGTRRALPA
ncbi:GNAT family N-acetyltransferase [Pengzhenrongella phosphoraccumulans]|uniref:bifunctional acetate--CoA ligase family protein/GNAT family N-acetyltransferase n=1 Tax=Pengzhenrongella phosphoraccumulans TaxID=3114394 RepID=UPI003890CC2F